MIENIFYELVKMVNFDVKIFRVGGTVRDEFIPGKRPSDQDYLITGIPFENLLEFLNNHGRVEHVGATFGVLKFYPHGYKFAIDIAMPRKEVSTGPGHKDFKVEFDHRLTIDDDLKRRDFTMNAIAWNFNNGQYYDPFQGKKDIKARVIRTIHKKAFKDDPLRILRGIQFAARLNFTIDITTLRLMKESVYLLRYISPERIAGELNKLMTAQKPSIGLRYLDEIDALFNLIPEFKEAKKISQTRKGGASTVFDHTIIALDAAPPDNLEVRWAILFHDLGKPKCRSTGEDGKEHFIGHENLGAKLAKKYLTKLRFPTIFTNTVSHLIKHHMFDAAPRLTPRAVRRLINKVGREHIFNLMELRKADRKGTTTNISMWKIDNLIEKIKTELSEKPFSVIDLNVTGHDVMKATGLPPGKEIGLILDILLYCVLYHDVSNEKEILLRHVPYPGEGLVEYCPFGTNFRLSKILEHLSDEKRFSWSCGASCDYICENKY